MTVKTNRASYVLPPNKAVWIPPNLAHETRCRSQVRFIGLYIDKSFASRPGHCCVFAMSPLARGLIHEVAGVSPLRAGALMPEDARLRRVCDRFLTSLPDGRDIGEWAQIAGMGRRTFPRHFRQQMGMGFSMWRQQVRLMEAVSRLSAGEPVTHVAYEVGDESASAFTATFQRAFGVPPRGTSSRQLNNRFLGILLAYFPSQR